MSELVPEKTRKHSFQSAAEGAAANKRDIGSLELDASTFIAQPFSPVGYRLILLMNLTWSVLFFRLAGFCPTVITRRQVKTKTIFYCFFLSTLFIAAAEESKSHDICSASEIRNLKILGNHAI